MVFKPGQINNPQGINNKVKALTNELRKQLVQNPEKLRKVAETLIKEAENGNMVATAMIFGRLEGAIPQTIDVNQTFTAANIPEADRRIRELAARFQVDVKLPPMLELQAEPDADS